jgi:hypothetical protein
MVLPQRITLVASQLFVKAQAMPHIVPVIMKSLSKNCAQLIEFLVMYQCGPFSLIAREALENP